MEKSVIIVAGGAGTRMGGDEPKQFLTLAGKPVLMHTIEKFYFFSKNIKIILILSESNFNYWKSLCDKYVFDVKHYLAKGGANRFDSVKNGLELVGHDCLVAIHDGVRPLVNINTIDKTFREARKSGNAVPVIGINESIRQKVGHNYIPVDRDKFYLVQTPQCFQSDLIKKAYRQNYNDNFTDDASVVESAGVKINLVEGNRENIKITYPEDLKIAEGLMAKFVE